MQLQITSTELKYFQKLALTSFIFHFGFEITDSLLDLLNERERAHGRQPSDPETHPGSHFLSLSPSLNTTQVVPVLQGPEVGSVFNGVGAHFDFFFFFFLILTHLSSLSSVDGQLDLEIQVNLEFVLEDTAVENAQECTVCCMWKHHLQVLTGDEFLCLCRKNNNYSIILLRV